MKIASIMRVAFITSESFTDKRHGGFGWLVKVFGKALARSGFEVFIITWRDPGYPDEYVVDNLNIITYPYSFNTKSMLKHILEYREAKRIIKDISADIYISIEAMVETLLAELTMRKSKHIIYAQDPFDEHDYKLLSSVDPYYMINKLRFRINKVIFGQAYKHADLILTQARFYIDKLRRLYGIEPTNIEYLPNPVHPIPEESLIRKSDKPLICYVGRMDPQKRYWIFFEMAKRFPDLKFVAMGKPSVIYEEKYKEIVHKYKDLKNLEILGFINEEEKQKVLDKCWILLLPSIREGLPIAMLEALAHKMAILSSVNPDGLTGKFGYWAKNDDFDIGLKYLLSNHWKNFGEDGYTYVQNIIISKVLLQH